MNAQPIPPRVNSQTFVGVLWGGTTLSLCFCMFRIFVRIKSFRKLWSDDFIVLAAWLMLLASAIIYQTQQTNMYRQYAISSGQILPTPEVLAGEVTFIHTDVATLYLFYSCLWSIKLSFLIFFRRLGARVKGHAIWWWCVLGLVLITWVVCISLIRYQCLVKPLEVIIETCSDQPGSKTENFLWSALHFNCAVDVLTDMLVLTIPVLMLWNVRISIKKKLALIGIFSLTIIAIIFSIVRVTVLSSITGQVDLTWLHMWSNVEMAVVIIVACLGSFRQLFIKSEQARRVQENNTTSFWRWTPPNLSISGELFRDFRRRESLHSRDNSGEQIVPLNGIYVSSNTGVSSKNFQDGNQMPQTQTYSNCYTG